jgi:hypothetical protein
MLDVLCWNISSHNDHPANRLFIDKYQHTNGSLCHTIVPLFVHSEGRYSDYGI